MTFWPFGRKRRAAKGSAAQPSSSIEKPSLPTKSPLRANEQPPPLPPPSLPIKSPLRGPAEPTPAAVDTNNDDQGRPRGDQRSPTPLMNEKQSLREHAASPTTPTRTANGKENVQSATRNGSDEGVTALPMSRRLEHSPHLRPVEDERAASPFSARPYSGSKTSLDRPAGTKSPPNVLRSKRSVQDSNEPVRRQSTKKRRHDPLREEEIRAMSELNPSPNSRRSATYSDSLLRRESKKLRGLGKKESVVSLPPADASIRPSTPAQRGWEIGILDILNPRPAVRLSGTPQYVLSSSLPVTSPLSRELSRREQKMPDSRHSNRKRQTIGNEADELDAAELRMILERDAKRRERKKIEQQEKLEKKLRSRNGRNRGDSDRSQRRRETEEALQRARETAVPPTDVHPALRDQQHRNDEAIAGLGIAADTSEGDAPMTAAAAAAETTNQRDATAPSTVGDPFQDPPHEHPPTPPPPDDLPPLPAAFSPIATPLDDPIVGTAQAVQLSHPTTAAPTSPAVAGNLRSPVSTADADRTGSFVSQSSTLDPKRASEPTRDVPRRGGGAWASFFRRGTSRKASDAEATPSELSFSNTSRESMRNQILPAHLIGTRPVSVSRRQSDVPIRTQSRFREDLPESPQPMSPSDSILSSADVTGAAAAAAAAARARRGKPSQPVDIPQKGGAAGTGGTESPVTARNDTPISPSLRGHGLMSASLASVDSEGSWLGGGSAQRQSVQSVLSRSLSKRNQEQRASSEDQGSRGGSVDKDADYFQRLNNPSAEQEPSSRIPSSTVLPDANPDEESDNDESRPETPGDPLTVHESLRRKPTLVYRNPRVKSREGLLTEIDTAEDRVSSVGGGRGGRGGAADDSHYSPADVVDEPTDTELDEQPVQRATSISYGHSGKHARQISAGSARLLEVQRRRASQDPVPAMPVSPTSSPRIGE